MKLFQAIVPFLISACAYPQAAVTGGLGRDEFRRRYDCAVMAKHRFRAKPECVDAAWAFHAWAATAHECVVASDCEVVIGPDPVGPEWIAINRARLNEGAGFRKAAEELCPVVEWEGSRLSAKCVSGECWLSGKQESRVPPSCL